MQTDLLDGMSTATSDLIVANPPYVPDSDAAACSRSRRSTSRRGAVRRRRRPARSSAGNPRHGGRTSGRRAAASSSSSASARTTRCATLAGATRLAGRCASATTCRASRATLVLRRVSREPTACSARSSRADSRRRSSTRTTLVAFKDINPQAPMHVLVVPRRHIATLNDLAAEDDALVGRDGPARRRARGASRATPSAATGRCSTATPTPGRRCSTSICTCSADGR